MELGAMIFATDYTIAADELARELEARGYESLFVPEHTHIPASRQSPWPGGADLPREYWNTFDPFISLSFAAAATKTLKLGTGICLLPQRDTLVTAKLVASLDAMSGGRFVFGIGGGWNKEEMAHHGVNYKTRFARMEEQVASMKGLWASDEAGFDGQYVRFSPSWANPKPSQQPHPPIILGGETDYTLDRIVRYCDGWLPRARHGFDAKANVARLHAAAARVGRDPAELTISVFGAPANAQTLREYAEAGITRAIFGLPSAPRDDVLHIIDSWDAIRGDL